MTGVAVAFGQGQPLMRFWKSKQASHAPEPEAIATRLHNIATRGRDDVPPQPDSQGTQPSMVTRRFWTPDELSQGSDD